MIRIKKYVEFLGKRDYCYSVVHGVLDSFSFFYFSDTLSCNAGSPDLEYFVSFLVLLYLSFLFSFIYLSLLGWRSHEL